tara:strand:+ start:130 stop:381 length:252 start_codon:yes stop_codon:yes gene_type:complete
MSKKTNYRKKYQLELINYFDTEKIYYDKSIIKGIMSKVAINSRNKYGCVDFEEELAESGIENGKFFYNEHNKQDTYNRRVSRL